jgi:hypothetical protein
MVKYLLETRIETENVLGLVNRLVHSDLYMEYILAVASVAKPQQMSFTWESPDSNAYILSKETNISTPHRCNGT